MVSYEKNSIMKNIVLHRSAAYTYIMRAYHEQHRTIAICISNNIPRLQHFLEYNIPVI